MTLVFHLILVVFAHMHLGRPRIDVHIEIDLDVEVQYLLVYLQVLMAILGPILLCLHIHSILGTINRFLTCHDVDIDVVRGGIENIALWL